MCRYRQRGRAGNFQFLRKFTYVNIIHRYLYPALIEYSSETSQTVKFDSRLTSRASPDEAKNAKHSHPWKQQTTERLSESSVKKPGINLERGLVGSSRYLLPVAPTYISTPVHFRHFYSGWLQVYRDNDLHADAPQCPLLAKHAATLF